MKKLLIIAVLLFITLLISWFSVIRERTWWSVLGTVYHDGVSDAGAIYSQDGHKFLLVFASDQYVIIDPEREEVQLPNSLFMINLPGLKILKDREVPGVSLESWKMDPPRPVEFLENEVRFVDAHNKSVRVVFTAR